MSKETVNVLVQGGKATAAPPIGPALSPLKVNVVEVVKTINEKTKEFVGMDIPVKIIVDTETRKFDIEIGTPPVASMLKKYMKRDKLRSAKDGNVTLPGSIKFDDILKIAKSKSGGTLKSRVKQVLGTCLSGGVLIDDRSPKDVIKEINEGKIEIEK
ncbi:MAG: 50S ribosomal protein L11 [Candidatus Aenigmatarchaeota archaeon]